jgi:hypothetical protein
MDMSFHGSRARQGGVSVGDLHRVDEHRTIGLGDEDRLLVRHGLVNERRQRLGSTIRFQLSEPLPERVDLIGVDVSNADLKHTPIVVAGGRCTVSENSSLRVNISESAGGHA